MVLAVSCAVAAERKPLSLVNTDEFTRDTQVSPLQAGDDHVAMVWWIPTEFWEAIQARDATTSEADKKAMLDALSGVSLLAAVQADVSPFGAFDFYPMEEVEQKMVITYTDSSGKSQKLSPMHSIPPNLEIVLGIFKPILGAAMGNMGNNMHFYVLDDTSKASARLVDPYQGGKLKVAMHRRDGTQLISEIETPLDALFVPRKCPNGKDAHISWKYCPWSGKELTD